MIDGVLHINGEPVKRERVDDFIETEEGTRASTGETLAGDLAERGEPTRRSISSTTASTTIPRSIRCPPVIIS
jgi:hypothetical protein